MNKPESCVILTLDDYQDLIDNAKKTDQEIKDKVDKIVVERSIGKKATITINFDRYPYSKFPTDPSTVFSTDLPFTDDKLVDDALGKVSKKVEKWCEENLKCFSDDMKDRYAGILDYEKLDKEHDKLIKKYNRQKVLNLTLTATNIILLAVLAKTIFENLAQL